ncbi:AAA family ATPase [Patescibacteria group bacterium]|nr:AAA family ATPase [Patescibacteria group bacterium]MBU4015996.1 AAA family ATPase [Patescibacteria group bacterium]MBU4098030.1 AAA family ATPase [Patescibacteria group bacterium]
MNTETHNKVSIYLRNQLAQAENRLKAYTVDREGKAYLKRSAALILEKYVNDFTKLGKEPRWIAVPGLRGAGKTTLLAQIYIELTCSPACKLYISLDEAKRVLGVNLADILSVYEELLGKVYEDLDQPVYLFIDEIQYEENWGLVLKNLYDRSKKVFIFCTGSSAVSIQTNPDVSRRVVFEKLYPMSFTEYMLLKDCKFPIVGLGKNIKETLLNSSNAKEVYIKLKKFQGGVNKYWVGINRLEIDNYLKYGTLPFTLQYNQEPLIYAQIEQTLTNILSKDIPQLSKFDQATMAKLNQILYAVSGSSITSLTALSKTFSMAINTLTDVFEVFEKAELLLRIYPHGSHFGQVRKPSKYLFISPAYRSMFFNLFGSTYTYNNYKGQLLEDAVGLYLYRLLGLRFGTSLTYDSAEGGADFIVSFDNKKIAIEVGYGDKDFKQVEATMQGINGAYGFSISPSRLTYVEEKNVVSVPLSYFLLT